MTSEFRPRSVLLSKRANVFYLERVRVMQKGECVVYLTEGHNEVESYFNLPERNTAFVLLGKGSSITDAAVRRLAAANVVVGFCGSGGAPLFNSVDVVFLPPQSEYRPTEYMQAWVQLWLDEEKRLAMAKYFLEIRRSWVVRAWSQDPELAKRGITTSEAALNRFQEASRKADNTTDLLSAEAEWARTLYALLARGFGLEFKREEGKGSMLSPSDVINGMLDHGNYIAYGYAAVALNGLGISYAFPVLHGKTRRGALVFDVADLYKDAVVMPLAFKMGSAGKSDKEFRGELIYQCQSAQLLDTVFDTLKAAIEKLM